MDTFDKILRREKENRELSFHREEILKKIDDCKVLIDAYIVENAVRSVAYYIAALYFFYIHLFDDYLDDQDKCARQFGINDEAGLALVEEFVDGSLRSIIEASPNPRHTKELYLTFFRYLRPGLTAVAKNFKRNFTDVEEFSVTVENGPIYRFVGELVSHLSAKPLANDVLEGFASIGEVAAYADDLRDVIEDSLADRTNIALYRISCGHTPYDTYHYMVNKIDAAKLKASQLVKIPVSTIQQLALCKIPTEKEFIQVITPLLDRPLNQRTFPYPLRSNLEDREYRILATHACKSKETKGRPAPDHSADSDRFRMPFQHDIDRIVHSEYFRRLENKTQVFIYYTGNSYRTRLTHTLEVQQFALSLGRYFQLNLDLISAIALGHDLGHTPFGHAGERALNEWLSCKGMQFSHNAHSVRVVDYLSPEEIDETRRGLNLTYEVREGIYKHSRYSAEEEQIDELCPSLLGTLEAQTVLIADKVAHWAHDIEDGYTAGLFTLTTPQVDQKRWPWLKSLRIFEDFPTWRPDTIQKLKGHMVYCLGENIIETTRQRLYDFRIKSVDDVWNSKELIVDFDSNYKKRYVNEIENFIKIHILSNVKVRRMDDKAERIVKALCDHFFENPHLIQESIIRSSLHTHDLTDEYNPKIIKNDESKRLKVIRNFIAWMTDREALGEYSRLFDAKTEI